MCDYLNALLRDQELPATSRFLSSPFNKGRMIKSVIVSRNNNETGPKYIATHMNLPRLSRSEQMQMSFEYVRCILSAARRLKGICY